MELTAINIFPVKALKGISLSESVVKQRGLQYDRRWMLVDQNRRFISQRECHQLALFQTEIADDSLVITNLMNSSEIKVPLLEETYQKPLSVQVWNDIVHARSASEHINAWFSKALDRDCSLVYMADDSVRLADPKYAPESTQVSFADGYPFLVISEASLSQLNDKLETPVPMNRFRPNFVINGVLPHEEDAFADIKIGDLFFRGVKPCARCIVPTIDQSSGVKGKEPLRTLSTYRKRGNKVLFGENLCWQSSKFQGKPMIKVGDKIQVISKKSYKSIENH